MNSVKLKQQTFSVVSAVMVAIGIVAIFLALQPRALAQQENIVQINAEGASNADTPSKARGESLREALNNGTLEIIKGLIGETRLEKNMPVIRSKILTQTQKFIQFYKASEPVKKGNDTSTSVNMKVSVSSLKDLLSQAGILNTSEGLATILPVIRLIDRRQNGGTYHWWTEEASPQNAVLREQEKLIVHQLDSVFRPKNFYVIDPVTSHYVQWMPQPFRVDSPAIADLLWMGQFFAAQMIIAGDAVVEPGSSAGVVKLSVRLTAYHDANGRVVGEVTRNFETTASDYELGMEQVLHRGFAEVSRDLAGQVFEEWSRGTLGATPLQLTLKGDFTFPDLENFKKQVLTKIGDVKSLRERRLERGSATFEVDSGGGLDGLVKVLETTPFQGFKVSVQQLGHNQLDLRWTKGG